MLKVRKEGGQIPTAASLTAGLFCLASCPVTTPVQGGKFDHADRLFHSVASTWSNCLSNTSDVKELIPEFYYSPEFLVNSNGYCLGTRQDGKALGHAVLPPWAQVSATPGALHTTAPCTA